MGKTLIVYYSRKGENYWNGSIRNLEKGNTETVAEMIAGLTGGDLFETDTVKPYARDYYACTDEGSGMGSSERDLKKICQGAVVEKGLSIHGAEAAGSRKLVEAWVK